MKGNAFKNKEKLNTLLDGSKLAVTCQEMGGGDIRCQVPTNNSQSSIKFSTRGGTSANITVAGGSHDIKAGKSIVHIIDNVLMPTANMTVAVTCSPKKGDETHKDKPAAQQGAGTTGTGEPSTSPKAPSGTGIHVPGTGSLRRVLHG